MFFIFKKRIPIFFQKVGILSFFTLLSRISGQIRTTLIATLLGTSFTSDCFYLAFKIPNLLRRSFAEGAMNACFIPIFNQIKQENMFKLQQQFFTSIFIYFTYFLLFIIILVEIFAFNIATFFYSFSNHSFQDLAYPTLLIRIMFPYIIFVSLAAICQGVLNSYKIFHTSSLTPIIFNFILILTSFSLLFSNLSIQSKGIFLAISVLIGGTFQLFIPLKKVFHLQFSFKFSILSKHNPHIKQFLKLLLPTFTSSSILQISTLIIDPIALSIEKGIVSILFYSNRLLELPIGIIGVSISTVNLPHLTQLAQKQNTQQLFSSLLKAIDLLLFLLIPILTTSLLFTQEIVSLVFQFGNFNQQDTIKTSNVFFIHILSLPAICLYRILYNLFFAHQNTKIPLQATILGVITSISLTITFTYFHPKVTSIALATTFSSYLITLFLIFKTKKLFSFSLNSFLFKKVCLYSFSILFVIFFINHLSLFQIFANLLNSFQKNTFQLFNHSPKYYNLYNNY